MGQKNTKNKSKKKKIIKEQETNTTIEDQLQYASENTEKLVKILVLGCGESGKTTFIKQLRILHTNGFVNSDRELYHKNIRLNIILHIKILLKACSDFGWELQEENKKIVKTVLLKMPNQESSLTPKTGKQIKQVWADSALKTAYENRYKFQLPDSANYYLDGIDRIADSNYVPTDRDILNCRVPTTGVNEIQFKFGDIPWNVIDVGGQRSERRKWIHQFDDVTLIIYVVATSEYNQQLFEDESVNRMQESLTLFTKTANNEYFREKKLYYEGGNDLDEAKKFIKKKFIEVGQNGQRNIFAHYTCATDTRNIEKVFDAVNVSILENTLKIGGYI
ncbi:guanine nucleotide-binding protein g(o) subunit alpha [Anaeramoeba flamelloides]|uniref:Guanine nucleotide-binding protein g(O) subunit alpha n=1 Tax=Anaeramoeba flamelloides TaxID=1746091 RepID=A0AAV7ZUE4_9EUKA|nr:guanine nucleotide-binding protein g(o) subunit alpha [Anaeramoeba flamelloides]